jgi:hypothetical protein
MMDDERIQQIIEMLEEGAGTSKGKSRLSWPDDVAILTANKVGLLRLACTLLRAAKEPILADDCRARPVWLGGNHDQVVEDDEYDMILGPVDRMETWPEPKEVVRKRGRRGLWRYRVQLMGCAVVVVILTAIFSAGIMAIWKFISGT